MPNKQMMPRNSIVGFLAGARFWGWLTRRWMIALPQAFSQTTRVEAIEPDI
jgi:hypothetical protein